MTYDAKINLCYYIWNGTNEFVSFVINSGRKFSIGVKCEVNVKK